MPLAKRRVASLYVLIGAVVLAATALAYYSYRYAGELSRRGEQAIRSANTDAGETMVGSIEDLIVASDQTLVDLVTFHDLREFPRRWSETARLSPAIESVLILDDEFRIVPDGLVSKKRKDEVDAFRRLFEEEILPAVHLDELKIDEEKPLHREFGGRYYLLSATKKRVGAKEFYIVLEADLVYVVSEVLPEKIACEPKRRLCQVVDEHGACVFGNCFSGIPDRYVVKIPFSHTLQGWRLLVAPTQLPTGPAGPGLLLQGVLIGLAVVTVFGGLGVLTYAMRAERRANQLKSDFIANVSHELKTPLSLIRMFGELLASGRTKGPDSAREYAEIITRESERLSRLIDNVLDFARIERGKVAYDFRVGDFGEVLSRGLDVYRYRLDREQMRLHVDVEEDLPPVLIDENAMTLVLLNLVDNAVKYAADGKELRVSLTRHEDRVHLTVRDRGPGIRADELDRIFERFYRARDVRGRPVRGSGIGLSLVKNIAEAHQGGVSVESTEGEGSAFTVWIPIATPGPERERDVQENAA